MMYKVKYFQPDEFHCRCCFRGGVAGVVVRRPGSGGVAGLSLGGGGVDAGGGAEASAENIRELRGPERDEIGAASPSP